MTLFEEICNEALLLNEDVSNTKINKAINGMHPVTIVYDDGDGSTKGKKWRLIYPVAYGLTSAGNPVIRAFQPTGDSKRGLTTPPNDREYPKWKYFRTDRIKSWNIDKTQTFNEEELVGFNEGGDDSMSVVYNIAPIGAAKQIHRQKKIQNQDKEFSNNKEVEIDDKPITKDEVEGIDTGKEEATTEKGKSTGKFNGRQIINWLINTIKGGFRKNKNINQQNTIDNSQKNTNIEGNELLNAPDTKPIQKSEVQGINTDVSTTQSQVEKPVTDKPITKDEVEGTDDNVQNNELTKTFKDLTNRMNNLYKNENENGNFTR